MDDIKKQWASLKQKYNLPSFEELDGEFGISAIEETNFPSKAVVEKTSEKIEFYAGIVSEMLQPDPANIYSMHETRFFDEQEKKAIYNIYTKLMAASRKCLELLLKNNEKEDADFIALFYKEWKNIKLHLISMALKMKESWTTEAETKEDLGYLG